MWFLNREIEFLSHLNFTNGVHMEEVLEDNGLEDFIDQEVPKPTDATQLAEWRKCVARARKILLEGVRDHIVSSLHGKETPFSKWKPLKDLY